jgi:hypothetical protein
MTSKDPEMRICSVPNNEKHHAMLRPESTATGSLGKGSLNCGKSLSFMSDNSDGPIALDQVQFLVLSKVVLGT